MDQVSLVTGSHASAAGLEGRDLAVVLEREGDVVEPVDETVVVEVVERERLVDVEGRHGDPPVDDVDDDLERRVVLERSHDPLDDRLGELDRDQPDLQAVVAEDVGEARRDDRLEPVVLEGPCRVLPRRAGAEVGPGDEHPHVVALVLGPVEHEVAALAPLREEPLAEAGALDPLEPVARDDLVGVDVGPVERHRAPDDLVDGFHQSSLALCGARYVRRGRSLAGEPPRSLRSLRRCRRSFTRGPRGW